MPWPAKAWSGVFKVAAILQPKEDFNVIVAGGQVRSRDGGIISEASIDFIHQFKVDFGIIGISGIDEDGSLLEFDYQDVRVAQAIIRSFIVPRWFAKAISPG